MQAMPSRPRSLRLHTLLYDAEGHLNRCLVEACYQGWCSLIRPGSLARNNLNTLPIDGRWQNLGASIHYSFFNPFPGVGVD